MNPKIKQGLVYVAQAVVAGAILYALLGGLMLLAALLSPNH